MRPAPPRPAGRPPPPVPASPAARLHRPRRCRPCTTRAARPGSVWWLDPPPGLEAGTHASGGGAWWARLATPVRLPSSPQQPRAEPDPSADPVAAGAALWADPATRARLLSAGCEPAAGCPALKDNPTATPTGPRLRVALLLSGGVDSAVAAALLTAAGHDVTPFYLKIWFEEDFRNTWAACPWEADLASCTAVCQALGLPPPTVVPLTGAYWDRVVSDCVRELRAGRTPNPDVLCNSRVKFGAFVEWLRDGGSGEGGGGEGSRPSTSDSPPPRLLGGFDRVATGHYARVLREPGSTSSPLLALCGDAAKDQTYFLARLSPAQRAAAMFPLAGVACKAEVRALAAGGFRLPNAGRPDSQGLCFLGKVPFAEFVAAHLGTWPGPILDADAPEPTILGFHEGAWFYTPGQRRGIRLAGGPWYVVRKDMARNAVWVSSDYHGDGKDRDGCEVGGLEWADGGAALRAALAESAESNGRPVRPAPTAPTRLRVKVRHGPSSYPVALSLLPPGDGSRVAIALGGRDQGLAPGQYAVFYDTAVGGGAVVGCGVIEAA
jgi:tRNA-5-taurinomethyluridine 2-sulfurtransferase